jgi:hypothetical protein
MRTMPRFVAAVLPAVFAAALTVAAPSLPAFAQNTPTKAQQEAATRFKKGLELFKDGDYQTALIEFRRANDLAPNFNVLYNIGQVSYQLQDYAGALNALEHYLSEGGSVIPAARRADVLRDIEKLRARVATIEIVSTVPDAEVTMDDITVGKTPLPKPILVSAGRHKITVSKAGLTAATRVVEVASGDSPKVLLDPSGEPKAAPSAGVGGSGPTEPPRSPEPPSNTPPVAASAPLPPPPPPPPSRPVPVAGIVVTSALTVGSVITGILALSASSALKSESQSSSATHDQLTSDATKTKVLAAASDVCTGSAIVAFGVTLYVGLGAKKEAGAAAPPGGLTQVRAGVSGNGVKLVGSF